MNPYRLTFITPGCISSWSTIIWADSFQDAVDRANDVKNRNIHSSMKYILDMVERISEENLDIRYATRID